MNQGGYLFKLGASLTTVKERYLKVQNMCRPAARFLAKPQ